MKKLLLVRHAKAVHDTSYSDFERPLKPSGIKDAEFMCEKLLREGIKPQILVTSPALRTAATADIFSEFLSLPKPREDERIYEASRLTMMNVISGFEDKYNFIGLVGHNPTIEDITYYLTNQMPQFSTCSVALIEFDFDEWGAISSGTGKLKWFGSPD
jgi:phosphohistidine phosphatase